MGCISRWKKDFSAKMQKQLCLLLFYLLELNYTLCLSEYDITEQQQQQQHRNVHSACTCSLSDCTAPSPCPEALSSCLSAPGANYSVPLLLQPSWSGSAPAAEVLASLRCLRLPEEVLYSYIVKIWKI